MGESAKHVIDMVARSTPFLAEQKIENYHGKHHWLTTKANNVRFINPAGYIQYYVGATVADIQQEVSRILSTHWLMWKFSPGLLVVEGLDNNYALSDASNAVFQPLEQIDYVRRTTLSRIQELKGLEFQHVFIFMDTKAFHEIQNGFSGTGQRIYNQRRLLRIPFSRAKDSLVTFAL